MSTAENGGMSMKYSERRRRQGEQTEQAILSSAICLMREKGFDQVSVRDICAHAGITTGAFYHHFRSKNELLDRGFAPLDQYMEQEMTGHEKEPPLDRLRRILTAYANFMEAIGGALIARYYQQRLSKSSMHSMDSSRFTLRAMRDCFQQLQEKAETALPFPPQWTAHFCFSHFRGVVIDWVLSEQQATLSQRMEEEFAAFSRFLFR